MTSLHPKRRRLIGLALALAALGITSSACSSGGSSSNSSTTSTTAAGTAPNKTAMATVLLRTSDFPAGWTESSTPGASTSDAQTKKVAQSITACRAFVAQSDVEKLHTNLKSPTYL